MSHYHFKKIGLITALIFSSTLIFAVEKQTIETKNELPSHNYPITGQVIDILQDPERMESLRRAMRKDISTDLTFYNVVDNGTLQKLYKTLLHLDFLDRDFTSALTDMDRINSLEDKRIEKILGELIPRAIISTRNGLHPGYSSDVYQNTFRENLELSLGNLPWAEIQDHVKESKARAEYISENLLLGVIESQVQPAVTNSGALDSKQAARLVNFAYILEFELPLSPVIADVFGQQISRNSEPMVDIWASREVIWQSQPELEPVVLAIWDAGVDVSVFPEKVWTNSAEQINGQDDDGNGYVDDLHGIAFDLEEAVSMELLLPLGSQTKEIADVSDFVQGFWDLISAIESPAAVAARKKISTLASDKVGEFINTLALNNHYMHGTHVAGIAVEGNPHTQILVARSSFDHQEPPRPLTIDKAHRLAESFDKIINYFDLHHVRVVNMSWSFDFGMIKEGLTTGGVGESEAERVQLAEEITQIMATSLKRAMLATPQILYITSAGNDGGNVGFDQVIPSSFVLPNLITVGAVDKAGNPTVFTSYGKNVKIYANGYQVESYVPGGRRVKGSGTSMSAPAVSNLAAKLIGLKPSLTPAQLVELIEAGADAHPENAEILLLNPKASWELLAEEELKMTKQK
jgi:subtilisin family serine protease